MLGILEPIYEFYPAGSIPLHSLWVRTWCEQVCCYKFENPLFSTRQMVSHQIYEALPPTLLNSNFRSKLNGNYKLSTTLNIRRVAHIQKTILGPRKSICFFQLYWVVSQVCQHYIEFFCQALFIDGDKVLILNCEARLISGMKIRRILIDLDNSLIEFKRSTRWRIIYMDALGNLVRMRFECPPSPKLQSATLNFLFSFSLAIAARTSLAITG